MTRRYKSAQGARFSDAEAQSIGDVIDSLGRHVTAESIVDAARPKKSSIHHLFEWNNSAAAREYRLEQARYFARHVVVEIKYNDTTEELRAFHHVKIVHGDDNWPTGGYAPMAVIRKSKALSGQLIEKALAEANGWQHRYQQYGRVFGGVFREIDKLNNTKPKSKV